MVDTAPTEGQSLSTSVTGHHQRWGRLGRSSILLYATLVLVPGWAYGLWRVHNDRQLTLLSSHQQLATYARTLSSQFEAMVADGVGAARAADNMLRTSRPGTDPTYVLAKMLTGGSYVRALFVVDPDVVFLATATDEKLEPGNLPFVDELRAERADVWVGKVMPDTAGRQLVVPVARRTQDSSRGSRWAGAILRLDELQPVYADLPRSRASVAIVTEKGRALTQIPWGGDNDTVNRDISATPILHQYLKVSSQPLTLMVGPSALTGAPRQYVVSRVVGLPLLATAGRDIADALTDWQSRTVLTVQFFSVATLAVYALALALQSLLNRRFLALERSEERYELAALASNDGLFEFEAGGSDVFLTDRAQEMLKLSAADGKVKVPQLRSMVHPADLPHVITAIRRHIEDRDRLDIETRLDIDGEYRWFRIRGQATWNAGGEAQRLAGSVGDIHEAVTAQAAVAEARRAELAAKESLARELLAAQEQERKRVAGELHDSIGQNLSLMRNRVAIMQRSALPAEVAPQARMLLDLATETIDDLRRVAQNLRPLHLEELGLVTALRTLMQKIAEGSDIAVHVRLEDIDDTVRGLAATHVYRIVQEATNNTLKHSGAKNLWLQAIRDITFVQITIRDDGRGFLWRPEASGIGMLSMRERANILGAHLEIESTPGNGCRIALRIPIQEESAESEPQEDRHHG